MSPAEMAVLNDDLREVVRECERNGGDLAVEFTAAGTRVRMVDAFDLGDLADELARDLKVLTS